jgi:hypothetical protein
MSEGCTLTRTRGATRGIGRAIAFHLAKRGASILETCSSPTTMRNIESLSSEVSVQPMPYLLAFMGNQLQDLNVTTKHNLSLSDLSAPPDLPYYCY